MNTSYFFVLLCCFGFGDARRAKTARLTKLADVAPEESVQGSNRQARCELNSQLGSVTKNETYPPVGTFRGGWYVYRICHVKAVLSEYVAPCKL